MRGVVYFYSKTDDIFDSLTMRKMVVQQDPRTTNYLAMGFQYNGSVRLSGNHAMRWDIEDSYFEVPLQVLTTTSQPYNPLVMLNVKNTTFNFAKKGGPAWYSSQGVYESCYFTNSAIALGGSGFNSVGIGKYNAVKGSYFDDSSIIFSAAGFNNVDILNNEFSTSAASLAVMEQGSQEAYEDNTTVTIRGNKRSARSVGNVYLKTGAAGPLGVLPEMGSIIFEDNRGIGIMTANAYLSFICFQKESDGSTIPALKPPTFLEVSNTPRLVTGEGITYGPTNAAYILFFSKVPVAGETVTFADGVRTWRAVPSDDQTELLIGANPTASALNLFNQITVTNPLPGKPHIANYGANVYIIGMNDQTVPCSIASAGVPIAGDTITFSTSYNAGAARTLTFAAAAANTNEVTIGGTVALTAANMETLLNGTGKFAYPTATAVAAGNYITISRADLASSYLISPGAGVTLFRSTERMHRRSGYYSTSDRTNTITGFQTGSSSTPGTYSEGTNMTATVFVQPSDKLRHMGATASAGVDNFDLINGADITGRAAVQFYNMYGTNYEVGPRFSGTGDPNLQTRLGSIGSIHSRRDGGVGTSFYVNTNATTNGWSPGAGVRCAIGAGECAGDWRVGCGQLDGDERGHGGDSHGGHGAGHDRC